LALTPIDSSQETFIREVDEELQRDQLLHFWQRYGRLLIAGVLGLLIALGGYLFWQDRQAKAAGVDGEAFDKALQLAQNKDVAGADKALDALKTTSNPGYRANALLTKAALAIGKNDIKTAATLFGQVAADESIAKPWRDLALVRQSAVEFDTAKPELIIARLSPLAVKGNPWHGSAGEMVAVSYLKQNKRDMAKTVFAAMAKDETIPETIRSRAVQIAGVLGADVVDATSEDKTK
jgi:hypothetical protein